MKKIIILEVENIKERTLFNFHRTLFNKIPSTKVLVLLWTTNDEEKKKKYEKIIKEYFEDLGASEVIFLKENDHNLKEKFKKTNVIYLPGGDTEVLLEKLDKNPEVIEELKRFKGVIIGNSAGAIALSNEGYGHRNGKLIKYKGLKLVNLKIFVHFRWEEANKIKESEIVTLEDNNYVVIIE